MPQKLEGFQHSSSTSPHSQSPLYLPSRIENPISMSNGGSPREIPKAHKLRTSMTAVGGRLTSPMIGASKAPSAKTLPPQGPELISPPALAGTANSSLFPLQRGES